MRGRRPKTTRIKLLTGNPGHRPIPPDETQPASGILKCPCHLDAEAKREWKRSSPALVKDKILTERDKAIFVIYCDSWSTMVAMKKILKRDGEFILSKERVTEYPDGRVVRSGGVMIAHPALKQYNEAAERARKALIELGMSPSSRGRVSAAKDDLDKQEQLQLDRFFK